MPDHYTAPNGTPASLESLARLVTQLQEEVRKLREAIQPGKSPPPRSESDFEAVQRLRATHPTFGHATLTEDAGRYAPLPQSPTPSADATPSDSPFLPDESPLMNLDQIAASVGRTKSCLQFYRTKRYHGLPMPEPDARGGGGQPCLWTWDRIRPWLEKVFRIALRPDFPGRRRL